MLLTPLMLVLSLQPTNPALEVIAQAYEASRQPYLIVNEDHSVDYHRHVSACLLDRVSAVTPFSFGAEAIRPGELPLADIDDYLTKTIGYASTSGFRDIWDIVKRHEMPAFGYDPGAASPLSDQDLIQRGLQVRTTNRRDHVSADRIIAFHQTHSNRGIYLHVGHAHASERWLVNDQGLAVGWLAAHIAQNSNYDPVTVQQLGPDRYSRYDEQGYFTYDLSACGSPYDHTVLLRLQTGVVGCVHRSRLSRSHASDFIILHDISGSDRNPITPRLCSTRP